MVLKGLQPLVCGTCRTDLLMTFAQRKTLFTFIQMQRVLGVWFEKHTSYLGSIYS